MSISFPQSIPQGWQCPVCRRVMAPGMPNCTGCPAPFETVTMPNTGTPLPSTQELLP